MDDLLNKITDFGDDAHGEQLRKYAPDRYMVHPKRVMQTLRNYTDDITILAAALLHDVLEDTRVSKGEMRDFLARLLGREKAERTLDLVVDLTDVYVKTEYPKLNRRTRKAKELERLEKTSPDSQTIKYADILDNTLEITDHDPDFARVYLQEVSHILKKLDKGNSELRQRAEMAVNDGIKKLGGSKGARS
jgi:(p)ppGpp synthase/HD superfamily hydrolase